MHRWQEPEKEDLRSLKASGETWEAIARHFGCTIGSCRGIWKRMGGTGDLTVRKQVGYEAKITKLEDELKATKRKYKAAQRHNTLQDEIIDAIAEKITPFEPVAPTPISFPRPDGYIPTSETVVAILSDWHFWEVVNYAEVGGLNEYNMDVATAYMQFLAEKVVGISQVKLLGYDLRKLHVFLLGDFVSTNIHQIMEHSPGTAVDSLLQGQYLVGLFLLDMCRTFDEVSVHGVVGNHGRLAQQKNYKKRYANWDYVLYNELAMMLALQPNVTFDFPESFFQIVEVEGSTFCLLHGDDVRSWNQIPWYGLDRAVQRFYVLLSKKKNIDVDYWCLGHFHNTGLLDGVSGGKLLNGSAIGTTDFSLGKLFTGNTPKQTMFGVHKGDAEDEYTGLSWRYDITLRQPKQQRYKIDGLQQIHQQWRDILTA